MDIEKLIERLNTKLQSYALYTDSEFTRAMEDAITAIETLRLESDAQEMQLNEFSEFLCHMTGGLLSKTNYTAQAMISAAEDYQQRVCDNDCELRAENEKLREKIEDARLEGYAKGLGEMSEENEKLRADVVRFNDLLASYQAERDAAVESIPHECKICIYYTVSFNGCTPDHDCTNPDGGCSNNYDRWQWRGIKED